MITFSKFGNHGRLGNQLHQFASLIGLSEKYECELILPEWKYSNYFLNLPKTGQVDTDIFIEEKNYHYCPEFWDLYKDDFKNKNVDVLGWLQSEKYWEHCKEKVHKALEFKQEFTRQTKTKFSRAFKKKTIAISVRRGDFITNPNFYLLPLEYYLSALMEEFSDYRNYNIIIFSDDLGFCKRNIKKLSNIFFTTGLNAMEQLCLMSLCDHFIISNSTFSWWGAMLGEKEYSKVIRPAYVFDGELKIKFHTEDLFPERWILFDHTSRHADISEFKLTKAELTVISNQLRFSNAYQKVSRKILHHFKIMFQ